MSASSSSGRIVALDAFRGLTVAFMILVNWPGSEEDAYAPLLHSPWNGLTPTDLVFPFFVFIAGVSAWFSFKRYGHLLTAGSFFKVLRRTVLIFLVGFLLNMFPFCKIDWITLKVTPVLGDPEFWANVRILGVLQRIALAYGLGVFLCLAFRGKSRSIGWVSAALLLLYWMMFYYYPEEPNPLALETNIDRKFDLWLLGANHLYLSEFYHNIPFDPESILGTISSAVSVMIGFLVGKAIDPEENGDFTDPNRPVIGDRSLAKILLAASVLLAVAWVWNHWFPVNKPLWTSTYTVLTAAMAMMFLACSIWLIDIKKRTWVAKPFVIFGANPLFLYVLAWCLYDTFMQWLFTRQGYVNFYNNILIDRIGPGGASLAVGLAFVFTIWIFGCFLYWRKIFIRL